MLGISGPSGYLWMREYVLLSFKEYIYTNDVCEDSTPTAWGRSITPPSWWQKHRSLHSISTNWVSNKDFEIFVGSWWVILSAAPYLSSSQSSFSAPPSQVDGTKPSLVVNASTWVPAVNRSWVFRYWLFLSFFLSRQLLFTITRVPTILSPTWFCWSSQCQSSGNSSCRSDRDLGWYLFSRWVVCKCVPARCLCAPDLLVFYPGSLASASSVSTLWWRQSAGWIYVSVFLYATV